MKTKSRSIFSMKSVLSSVLLTCSMGISLEAAAERFCTHGSDVLVEGRLYMTPTRLLRGDFDGDGKMDYFCKDVRAHSSNGNRLLEWLILGNGARPFSGVWNEWCTHRGSYIHLKKRGNKTILVCTDDTTGYWERELP